MLHHLLLLLVPLIHVALAGAGYQYNPPTAPSTYTGHKFGILPTIQALPPVPALPALPTPRSSLLHLQHQPQQQQQQQHYQPPSAPVASIINHYINQPKAPPAQAPVAAPLSQVTFHGTHAAHIEQPIVVAPQLHVPFAKYGPPESQPFSSGQPLRVPFGKQLLFAPGESYELNGRQLKQYAVIEIVDNDIEQSPTPFLNSPFFDEYRAHIGASGTGAAPAPLGGGGVQIGSRANSLLLQQQGIGAAPQNEAIALGSGGLGFIRHPNGNVYLGSGSLAYISGQQRVASVLDARTRADTTPDALHFGHGPLGGVGNFLRFK